VDLAIHRHGSCDWGCITSDQRRANCAAVAGLGGRIVSRYMAQGSDLPFFYLLTEEDFTYTTIFLQHEMEA
jgi:hypothetical protein